jgi:hypothetical protein
VTTPATPIRVEWSRLDPRRYEDMIAVLLSNLYPTVVRTDGAGGDGGRDVHFSGPAGLEIFELKSFIGRFTPHRVTQVKRSFARARENNPKTWTVVCPIDLTREEQNKFAAISAGSGIESHWFGKTWLDAKMAEYPGISRYFLNDVNDEIIQLAKELGQEQAALTGGLPDALDRLRVLMERCDALDPYYRIDIATDSSSGAVSATLVPRYAGAELDRPITLQATMTFADVDAAEATDRMFRAAADFGIGFEIPEGVLAKVVVDAPAGFGGEFSGGVLQIADRVPPNAPEFTMRLAVAGPDGRHIVSLPLSGRTRSVGGRGLIVDLKDAAELILVEIRIDISDSKFTFHYTFSPRPCTPSVALPVMRFMAALQAPNTLTIQLGTGQPIGPPAELPERERVVDERSILLAEMLARVQEATSSWFDAPTVLTRDDVEALALADQLLKGEIVQGTWERFAPEIEPGWQKRFVEQHIATAGDLQTAISLWLKGDITVVIAGHEIPLGLVTTHVHSARLEDPSAAARILGGETGVDIELAFVPASVDIVERWLGPPEARPTHQGA